MTVVAAYIFGVAEYQARQSTLIEPNELYVPRSIDVVIALWCLWVGSSIGSFLNVVVWRMPRGESINGRSHCPRCQAKLKARDNFPVFGWLALGGRCRTCHLPISSRYPIVEAIVGLSIALVAISELYRLSLPRQVVHWHGGPLWAPVVDLPILLTLLYHVVGLSTCWALGLIRMDNQRLPSRLVSFGLAACILPMIAYPTLMVVSWQVEVEPGWRPSGLHVDALVRVVASLAAATFTARYLARGLCPAADPKLDPLGRSTARLMDLIVILAVPTIVVGWQAALAITVLASLIAVALQRWLPIGSDALGRFAVAMPLALTFQLVFWRRLHTTVAENFTTLEFTTVNEHFSYWPSDGSSPWIILIWAGLVSLVPLWLRDESPSAELPAGSANQDAGGGEEADDALVASDEGDPDVAVATGSEASEEPGFGLSEGGGSSKTGE